MPLQAKFPALGGVFTALTGPVGIVIAIIAALVGAFIFAWNTSDLDKLNFGGTISTGIYSGQDEINRAMVSVLDIPALANLNASLGVKHTVTRNENQSTKQPAVIKLRLGKQEFSAFVQDISDEQGDVADLNLLF